MEALEAVFTRRSTRKFSEVMPDRALIDKVIEAGAVRSFMMRCGLLEDETVTGALALGYPEGGALNRETVERKGNPVTWV